MTDKTATAATFQPPQQTPYFDISLTTAGLCAEE